MRKRLLNADVYYGWVVATAGFGAATVLFGLSFSFAVFLDPLLEAFPVGSGTVSLVFGVQTFVLYTGSVPGGTVVDTVGARRSALLATVLVVGGLVGASVAQRFVVLLGWYGVVTGLGMSLLYVVAYTAVPRWFDRHRGLATGFASSGLGIGLLVIPPVAAWLVERLGWRGAYLWLGIGAGSVLLAATYLLADSPQEIGENTEHEFPYGEPPAVTRTPLREQVRAVSDIATSRAFLGILIGWLFVWTPLYVLMNHVVRFATEASLPTGTGVAAISLIGVTTSLARIGVGSASDRLGRVRTFVVSAALIALAVPALTLVDGRPVFFALTVVFGIGYGGAGALLSPLVAELFGAENLGTVFGLASVAFAVSGLSAPVLAGLLFETVGSYTPVFWAAGAVGLLGAGLVWSAGAATIRRGG
ncbi:MFS transporter [Halanaeroarchaeum sulfurireducens]|uniref:MFS transporter n=1 Tax=Halanaeroarchaeum sulfurireducens TaxID=1604004 RepID=UPI00138E3E8D|nr:MFS transporter [Halanaeroarchaeum sulfurireducens]